MLSINLYNSDFAFELDLKITFSAVSNIEILLSLAYELILLNVDLPTPLFGTFTILSNAKSSDRLFTNLK